MRWVGVEPVSRGDTIKLSGCRTHRVSWVHVQTFVPLGHKADKANARGGGDTSVSVVSVKKIWPQASNAPSETK